jgi:hypothetical protein
VVPFKKTSTGLIKLFQKQNNYSLNNLLLSKYLN